MKRNCQGLCTRLEVLVPKCDFVPNAPFCASTALAGHYDACVWPLFDLTTVFVVKNATGHASEQARYVWKHRLGHACQSCSSETTHNIL